MTPRPLRALAALLALVALAVVPLGAAQDGPTCAETIDNSGQCDLAVRATAALVSETEVQVDVTVTNEGSYESLETTVTVTGGGDWAPFGGTVKTLPPKESQEFSPIFDIPPSARGALAVFDVAVKPVPGEAGQGPNETRTRLEIPPAPDLELAEATARVLDGGERVEVSGLVRNVGAATDSDATVTVSAPGWDDGEQTLTGGLEPEDRVPFSVVLETPDELRGATVSFRVSVEPLETEARTDNNAAETAPVEIPPAEDVGNGDAVPDLAVTRAAARLVDARRRVEVTGSIVNQGDETSDPLRVTVAAPGWDAQSRSLAGGLARGEPRPFRLVLAIPEDARGREVSFRVEVAPVAREENLVNNARETAVLAVPPAEAVEDPDDGSDIPWALVAAGAALAAAAGLAAWQLAHGRGRGPRTAGEEQSGRLSGRETSPPPSGRPERTVSTGFASEWDPGGALRPDVPLSPATPYVFWVEVGAPVEGSIEVEPTELPDGLPAGATLTVALFPLDETLTVEPGGDVGELRLETNGEVVVVRPAAAAGLPPRSELDLRRLSFRVRTGAGEGTGRLRCNVYHGQVLVQARLISAEVRATAERVEGALRSQVDYTLAPSLDPARLAALEPHRLSVLVNESAGGSHDFYFLGEGEFKNRASFGGYELQNLITRARMTLRRAAWGDTEEWVEGKAYRYEGFDLERLRVDLTRFALGGYRFYDAIVNRLAGGPDAVDPLAELMLEPGLVQFASRESPTHLVPASLIYDYPLDTTQQLADYELCRTFLEALDGRRALEDSACFRGACPNRLADTVVCPSGFWGYRHALGLPVSVASAAPDLPTEIAYADGPHLVVAVSTDPDFVLRAAHEQALRELRTGLVWYYADTRERALALLRETRAQVVYFYCHGGVAEDIPFIQVGPPDERGITRDLLRRERIAWSSPRPLVFINGCHTTALEPEKAIELVSGLVETSRAAGVVGTEITVFEPLASAFAEACLRRFLDGEPLGAAVRGARLALLAAGNPLGLAYIPFALASLRLREQQPG